MDMDSDTMDFLGLLDSFNRKERFFLVGYALGNPTFRLDERFAENVSRVTEFGIPADAHVFMDYHLDWLHTAAYLSRPDFVEATRYDNAQRINTGNQEDVDLLVAFNEERGTRVILIEAKAETGWINKHLDSKALRLKAIFGESGADLPGVTPTFVLTSPRESAGIDTSKWPPWMRGNGSQPLWMELKVPPGRRRVIGCDEAGKPSRLRSHFKVILP